MPKLKPGQHDYQFYFFRLGYIAINMLVWVYFTFLVLRTSENLYDAVPLIFQSHGAIYLGMFVGFILMSIGIKNIGYRDGYRIGFFLEFIATGIMLLNMENILEVYLIVSIIRGLGAGAYWLTTNTYVLREQHGSLRSKSIGIIFTAEYILGIIIPTVAGFMVEEFNYPSIFILGMIYYVFIILFPFHERRLPDDNLQWRELTSLRKRTGFKRLTIVMFTGEIFNNQRAIIFAFLPFLLIGDELQTGLFMSAVGIFAALISFFHRNDDDKHQVKNGYIGAGIVSVATSVFVVIWSVPALFIREVIAKLGFALWSPVQMNMENQVQEMFLKDFINNNAVEMAFYREMVLISARICNLILFMVIFYILKLHPAVVLRAIILITIIREFFYIAGYQWVRKALRISPTNPGQLLARIPLVN